MPADAFPTALCPRAQKQVQIKPSKEVAVTSNRSWELGQRGFRADVEGMDV